MHTVEKCCVISHRFGERVEQVRCLEHHIYALVDVADKNHRSRGRLFLFASGKGTGSHVILHDLNTVFVFERDARNLIKSHAIPEPYKPYGLGRHIVEEVCHRRLSTGHEDAVWRNLLIQVRLARAAGSQFTEIEVVFNEGEHAGELQPLFSYAESVGFHTRGTEQNGDPFVFCKRTAAVLYFLHVNVRHLNRCEFCNSDRRGLLVFLNVFILKTDNAPNAAAEQAVILRHIVGRCGDTANTEVGKIGFVTIEFDIQTDSDAVDDRVTATLA